MTSSSSSSTSYSFSSEKVTASYWESSSSTSVYDATTSPNMTLYILISAGAACFIIGGTSLAVVQYIRYQKRKGHHKFQSNLDLNPNSAYGGSNMKLNNTNSNPSSYSMSLASPIDPPSPFRTLLPAPQNFGMQRMDNSATTMPDFTFKTSNDTYRL